MTMAASSGSSEVPTDFFSLLRSEKYLPVFQEWLRQDHSFENYLFWRDVEEFKQLPHDQMEAGARKILSKYFELGCDYEINTDHHQKLALKEKMNHPSLDMFDDIQISIFLLMRLDSYPKFIESDAFAIAQGKTPVAVIDDAPPSDISQPAKPATRSNRFRCIIL
jgi:hypothetical protein